MEKRSNFLLSKWYLDCVSADGDVFIGYVAELRWSGPSIHYSSTLKYHEGQPITTTTSLRKSQPMVANSTIEWKSPNLQVAGCWEADAQTIERTMLESEHGEIRWSCLQPRSTVRIAVGNETMEGLGYVEDRKSVV